jgi:hypothetical protein
VAECDRRGVSWRTPEVICARSNFTVTLSLERWGSALSMGITMALSGRSVAGQAHLLVRVELATISCTEH